jgi:nitronate monooxygenase
MVSDVARWRDRRLLDRLGLSIPLIQAPMAGASGPQLAIAAIHAGGLGSLPCALLTPATVREQVAEVRSQSAGPLNLNFFCHDMAESIDDSAWRSLLEPYYAEFGIDTPGSPPPLRKPFDEAMCAVIEELRPEVVSFHFGLPADSLLARIRDARAFIIANATSPAEARWLAERGVDAIIAQGYEAGGHAGSFLAAPPGTQMGLMALLPQVVDAVAQPVIAAGGIGDGRGMAAALMLGASAVQLGTCYLRSPECFVSPSHRAALDAPDAEQTQFTNLFTGRLARGLPNRLMNEVGPVRPEAPVYPHAATALAPLRAAAETRGESDFSALWAGQAAALGSALPARRISEQMASEALDLLGLQSWAAA